jgi:hypothetical protein
MIFNFFSEAVETQLTGSILPLSIKFFGASQRILKFSRKFGASSLIRIIFFSYSDGTVSVFKNAAICFLESCLIGSEKKGS